MNKERFPLLINIIRFLRTAFVDILEKRTILVLSRDCKNIKQLFELKYPQFVLDEKNNTKCVSCNLCVDVCPTHAIEIKKANMVNFPESLTTGEAPLHIYLDVKSCVKCGECMDVCLVDALSLNANYVAEKVDLVSLDSK